MCLNAYNIFELRTRIINSILNNHVNEKKNYFCNIRMAYDILNNSLEVSSNIFNFMR